MKFISYSAATLLLILSPVLVSGEVDTEEVLLNPNIDTNADYNLLKQDYVIGETYLETVAVDQVTKMKVDGVDMGDSTMHMEGDSHIAVSAIDGGGKRVEITFDHIFFKMGMMDQIVEYDSDKEEDQNSPYGAIFSDSMYTSLVIDDEGTVASSSENNDLQQSLGNPAVGGSPVAGLGSSQRFEQMSRMAKTLPDHEVKPGDKWPFDFSEKDMVTFKGTAELLGYSDIKGHKCAVIAMEGNVDVDMGGMGNLLGEDEEEGNGFSDLIEDVMENVQISDGKMTATLHFDPELRLIRSMYYSTSMLMGMSIGGSDMDMDVDQVMHVETSIQGE